MSEELDLTFLKNESDDIKCKFNLIWSFLEKNSIYQLKVFSNEARIELINRLLKVLKKIKENNKLDLIDDTFLDDTKWFSSVDNYINTLYAIYLPKDFILENEDDYLFCISNIIINSTIGYLKNKGKNYQIYFESFYEILNLYSICLMFLKRDISSGLINKTEKHFFEIVLVTLFGYYYVDYDNIDREKIVNTIHEICNYQLFIEKWSLNGIGKKEHGNYEKEKFIAKALISNIDNTKKIIID